MPLSQAVEAAFASAQPASHKNRRKSMQHMRPQEQHPQQPSMPEDQILHKKQQQQQPVPAAVSKPPATLMHPLSAREDVRPPQQNKPLPLPPDGSCVYTSAFYSSNSVLPLIQHQQQREAAVLGAPAAMVSDDDATSGRLTPAPTSGTATDATLSASGDATDTTAGHPEAFLARLLPPSAFAASAQDKGNTPGSSMSGGCPHSPASCVSLFSSVPSGPPPTTAMSTTGADEMTLDQLLSLKDAGAGRYASTAGTFSSGEGQRAVPNAGKHDSATVQQDYTQPSIDPCIEAVEEQPGTASACSSSLSVSAQQHVQGCPKADIGTRISRSQVEVSTSSPRLQKRPQLSVVVADPAAADPQHSSSIGHGGSFGLHGGEQVHAAEAAAASDGQAAVDIHLQQAAHSSSGNHGSGAEHQSLLGGISEPGKCPSPLIRAGSVSRAAPFGSARAAASPRNSKGSQPYQQPSPHRSLERAGSSIASAARGLPSPARSTSPEAEASQAIPSSSGVRMQPPSPLLSSVAVGEAGSLADISSSDSTAGGTSISNSGNGGGASSSQQASAAAAAAAEAHDLMRLSLRKVRANRMFRRTESRQAEAGRDALSATLTLPMSPQLAGPGLTATPTMWKPSSSTSGLLSTPKASRRLRNATVDDWRSPSSPQGGAATLDHQGLLNITRFAAAAEMAPASSSTTDPWLPRLTESSNSKGSSGAGGSRSSSGNGGKSYRNRLLAGGC